jgi:ribosomal protein S5
MKTTVEIPDALLREAKRVALREKTTVRALIERGLRAVVAGRRTAKPFTLRPAAFDGDGLVAGRSLRDWEAIRDLSYSERGA